MKRDLSGLSPSDKALDQLFKLLGEQQEKNKKLMNTIENVKRLLLKGKTEEALQIIVKGEKEDDKRSQGKVNEHIF
ncbi:hypothetical protein P4H94_26825 [Paenibacillus macerans]|uniref:hypothetical protein n=1 Tax=Paenibacillus macerans TaxID=44252 RepID=UPI002DBCAEAE|nr:hypothetical protein [Paenibacillus macerans]MEC0140461.1 hypothetical protein [Paenibacillus macerans]